jgi:GMP synthase-like glutamine amidotransferase
MFGITIKQILETLGRRRMNVHYFQHVFYEDLGCIENWIKEKGFNLTSTKFFHEDKLPKVENIDWLIIMGGPMGVYDEDKYFWLKKEKEFIKEAIAKDKIVIGICLGAQLIAESLGAKVYPNKQKEIGWFPIKKIGGNNIFENMPNEFTVFHWHGDTFDLPGNSVHLAKSAVCENQAFLYKENVFGLQFHLEVTSNSLRNMTANGKDELTKDKYIQSESEILNSKNFISRNNEAMIEILNHLHSLYKE